MTKGEASEDIDTSFVMGLQHRGLESTGGASTRNGGELVVFFTWFVCCSVRYERATRRYPPSTTGGGTNPRKGKVAGGFVGEDWDKK